MTHTQMFEVDPATQEKINRWEDEQDAIVLFVQGNNDPSGDPDSLNPYYGAIGGSLTYCFMPTAIGVILKVRHAVTKNELDVTDYDKW